MTHAQLCYRAAGSPDVEGVVSDIANYCATCGAHITEGVSSKDINNPTFSQHGDFLKGEWVCRGCMFMYKQGKAKPGNYLAVEDSGFNYLAISSTGDKKSWHEMLIDLIEMPEQTRVTGVLTADVKPRLWPRSNIATVGYFGLYVHSSDYDISEYREFDLQVCLDVIEVINQCLSLKFTKASIYQGLFGYHKIAIKDLTTTQELEAKLSPLRDNPAFIPALIIARG